MKRAVFMLPLALVLAAAPAWSAPARYSYIDAAYMHSEVSDTDVEAQGPRLGLNISLKRGFYFTGEYDQQHFADSNNKVSASAAGFGIHGLGRGLQMFLAGTYERLDFNDDDAALDARDEGYGVQLGFRLPLGPIELGGDAKYLQIGRTGTDEQEWRYRGMLQSRLTRNIAAVFGYETFDQANVDQITAGLRVYFDTRHDWPRKKKRPRPAEAED